MSRSTTAVGRRNILPSLGRSAYDRDRSRYAPSHYSRSDFGTEAAASTIATSAGGFYTPSERSRSSNYHSVSTRTSRPSPYGDDGYQNNRSTIQEDRSTAASEIGSDYSRSTATASVPGSAYSARSPLSRRRDPPKESGIGEHGRETHSPARTHREPDGSPLPMDQDSDGREPGLGSRATSRDSARERGKRDQGSTLPVPVDDGRPKGNRSPPRSSSRASSRHTARRDERGSRPVNVDDERPRLGPERQRSVSRPSTLRGANKGVTSSNSITVGERGPKNDARHTRGAGHQGGARENYGPRRGKRSGGETETALDGVANSKENVPWAYAPQRPDSTVKKSEIIRLPYTREEAGIAIGRKGAHVTSVWRRSRAFLFYHEPEEGSKTSGGELLIWGKTKEKRKLAEMLFKERFKRRFGSFFLFFPGIGTLTFKMWDEKRDLLRIKSLVPDGEDDCKSEPRRHQKQRPTIVKYPHQTADFVDHVLGKTVDGSVKFSLTFGQQMFFFKRWHKERGVSESYHTRVLREGGIGPADTAVLDTQFNSTFPKRFAETVEGLLLEEGFELIASKPMTVKLYYNDVELEKEVKATCNLSKTGCLTPTKSTPKAFREDVCTYTHAEDVGVDFRIRAKAQVSQKREPTSFFKNKLLNALRIETTQSEVRIRCLDATMDGFVTFLRLRREHRIYKRGPLVVKVSDILYASEKKIPGWEVMIRDGFLDNGARLLYDRAAERRSGLDGRRGAGLYEGRGVDVGDIERSFRRMIEFGQNVCKAAKRVRPDVHR